MGKMVIIGGTGEELEIQGEAPNMWWPSHEVVEDIGLR